VGANQTHLSKFDPDVHFLGPYATNEEFPDARPHGISGSGVWTPKKVSPPGVWYPKVDLAGITIGYYRSSKVLQFVRREVIERFLREHFG